MRILVCGGRNFNDRDLLYNTLYDVVPYHEPDEYGNTLPKGVTIISGMARGADMMAYDWAVVNWCEVAEYPANWDKHGKAAGPIRNQQMLDEGKPDLVIAFKGGNGTIDMVRRSKKAGIETRLIGW